MVCKVNFLRPLRLLCLVPCAPPPGPPPSWPAQHLPKVNTTFPPRLQLSNQSLHNIGSHLDCYFADALRRARTRSCTRSLISPDPSFLSAPVAASVPSPSSPIPCPSNQLTSTCQPTVPVTASTVAPKERYQNSSKTVDRRHDYDTTRQLSPTSPTHSLTPSPIHSLTVRPSIRPSHLF